MPELLLPAQISQEKLATTMVIGGALTRQACRPIYEGHLGEDPFLSARERFFPNPSENVRNHEETYKRTEETAEQIYSKSDSRLLVVGHSFGGLMATKLGLRRPDLVAAVKSIAGLQEGYSDTIGVKAVKMVVGNGMGLEDGRRGSKHIREFHEEIREKWSPDVQLTLDSALFDVCFPLPEGLNICLPEGQSPVRRIVGPNLPFLINGLRLARRGILKDVKLLTSITTPVVTEHVFLPALSVETHDTQLLRAAVAQAEENKRLLTVSDEADFPVALAA